MGSADMALMNKEQTSVLLHYGIYLRFSKSQPSPDRGIESLKAIEVE
jgi:hypothetical protein